LHPQFARTEISLDAWMPKHEAAPMPPAGKPLREFELMQELSASGIPIIASIWRVPDWMSETVELQEGGKTGKYTILRPGLWNEAADAICAYLNYAKEKHHAEADFFSFNEPDCGVKIKLSPEEHRDFIKLIGAKFKVLGLKTKCLLGDVSNPRVPLDYVRPALNDPEALKYAGALAIHSWNGGSPEQYRAWSDLAVEAKLPLFVSEAGVDAGAWTEKSFRSYDYAVLEIALYQELLQFARPQAILYWEFSGDYSLIESLGQPGRQRETARFAIQRHFIKFIPPGSEALEVSGANPFVACTAFKHAAPDGPVYALQLSNTGWPRQVRVKGIPHGIKELNTIQTTQNEIYQARKPVSVTNGEIEFELPARSLTTLISAELK
jgi:O-glycosyl hydrolase